MQREVKHSFMSVLFLFAVLGILITWATGWKLFTVPYIVFWSIVMVRFVVLMYHTLVALCQVGAAVAGRD